ncbi:MAG: hypothetical protein ONB13_00310 [candidate division KSB1 bacterium]|nr:hypothetical protein [candidate division KSB1 bacterium]MDZ7357944.1 hypothetical protein [candidate division KSB1 bacterium]MDZ7375039.1 hypothetical protein [candidate division KSB1 bacterium]MDZ7400982.1 hypothetical protein [candidate division KSB1 bacterium]
MRLSAPKKFTWWISLILAIIAIVFQWLLPNVHLFTGWQFVLLLVSFVLLFLSTFVKGL